MERSETSTGQAARAAVPVVSDSWLEVSSDLLQAVNHALNNRLAALISLVRVLEYGETAGNPLLAVLQQEVDRLERTTALLRLLPRERRESAEPLRLPELFADVLALHRLRSDARELDFDIEEPGDLAPTWAPPGALAHALLMLLSAVTPATAPGNAAPIRVRYRDGDEHIGLVVEVPASLVEPRTGPGPDGWADTLAAAGALLQGSTGGELIRTSTAAPGPGLRIELRLPTLAAVRARETDRDVGSA